METHNLLYPKPTNSDEKHFIGYVNYQDGMLCFTYFNGNKPDQKYVTPLDPIELFDKHPILPQLKTVIFNFDKFFPSNYSNNIVYQEMVAEKMRKQKIAFEFITNSIFMLTASLVAASIVKSYEHKNILHICINPESYTIIELCRKSEDNIYEAGIIREIDSINKEYIKIKEEILGGGCSFKPTLIIVFDPKGENKTQVETLSKKILIPNRVFTLIIDDLKTEYFTETIANIAKRIFDPTFNQFHINRLTDEIFCVMRKRKDEGNLFEAKNILLADYYELQLKDYPLFFQNPCHGPNLFLLPNQLIHL